jgi:hypothetical protein
MKDKFITAFETVLAINQNGEVKNLLITDDDTEFLDEALYQLRYWCVANGFNLVELDEKAPSWLPEIQSRELFDKLNQPNTVLMIKNYATVTYMRGDDNTPRNFLRDAVLNRHYGCGNDFVPSDKLPNLKFVVVINDLSYMDWRNDEYMTFSVIHRDNTKKTWTNTQSSLITSKMHPVMSAINKTLYYVSDDETTLCIDIAEVYRGVRLKHAIRSHRPTVDYKTEINYTYIESNLPDFNDRVLCIILRDRGKRLGDMRLVIDVGRLKQSFPKLETVCCDDMFSIKDPNSELCILDPFETGEVSFRLAQEGKIDQANAWVRNLWALDNKWARFFREVAVDYQCKREDHHKVYPDGTVGHSGMDNLFRIYLLGWYSSDCSFDAEHNVSVSKHKNFDKAIELLSIRFKNWDINEICEKLYWDLEHVKIDEAFDKELFSKILSEAKRLFPGALEETYEFGWIESGAPTLDPELGWDESDVSSGEN